MDKHTTRFTGYLIDPEFQNPEPEEVEHVVQEVAEALPAFREFERERRLDEV